MKDLLAGTPVLPCSKSRGQLTTAIGLNNLSLGIQLKSFTEVQLILLKETIRNPRHRARRFVTTAKSFALVSKLQTCVKACHETAFSQPKFFLGTVAGARHIEWGKHLELKCGGKVFQSLKSLLNA